MWLLYAFLSAIFAGLTSILAKIGAKDVDSDLLTAIRTFIVLIFSFIFVLLAGSLNQIKDISSISLIFLVLSGIATGLSWLCYFKALKLGDVNKVTPIDKSSTILTMLLAFIILGEEITLNMALGMVLMGIGTYLMIERKKAYEKKLNNKWFYYAVLSAIFASLTAILAKIGIQNVESNLATFIRTGVVLILAWGIVFSKGKQKEINGINKKGWQFIVLSALATGFSWICYYKALQDGIVSIVVPIDKLSILVSVSFAYIIFKEKLSKKGLLSLFLLVIGTLTLLIKF